MAASMPIALWFGAKTLGLVGVAWPWLLANAVAAVVLGRAIIPKFLGPHFFQWLINANFLQFAMAAVATYSISWGMEFVLQDSLVRICVVGIAGTTLCTISLRYTDKIVNLRPYKLINQIFGTNI